ncbi:MAG: 3-methyl-2-oxobutanoate hydroxymethyltransferase [Rhodospirillaceae bacterium]|jgi:3-methyl-2-oxobutanoate hydroxymethyltransferase|nr:3-methyl-2-oxobutanoate hydroxymethyltransferase [Rhodospirillaceae bacterium]MBT4589553.1 3-methyl-2-oxobutanoate hydroxymethyltransferase [Rhodospirillaceae bacterium]MBT4938996.1 3-methyl-2-oxobutanoate hydroxymethyltransferase [Rhodospirillaceae bacterium]MBT5939307.1 3-methyl-2-oxobutanoate hydroxymethyltransferase [Rhodospirillaceae bacterium]MBT7265553.1 3-methyl-2-oxobutanoate hydroxymethyltransferase [Rhodospirillaceae bacterium]
MSTNSTLKIVPKAGPARRVSVPDIAARKGGEPVVSLTAYTAPMAKILDPHCDFLLVGDSLGMVLYGLDSTLGVTLDMAINHGAAVVRGSSQACVVVDMPFGTYQESPEQAYRNCARVLVETGCAAVKIEGGAEMAETVSFLVERGIPVMGHVGLMPQSVNIAGGYRAHGRNQDEARKIKDDAHAIADAGAFALVIEGVVEQLASDITREIQIVTIGIGASAACDGQVLVTEDAMGMFTEFTPKFVKRFAEMGEEMSRAAADYAKEVKARTFPAAEHCYGVRKDGK